MRGERKFSQVAIKLFSQRGFSGTTTKEIARTAGVSEAMVFRHFANKEELYSALLDHKACDRQFRNRFDDLVKKTEAKDDFGVFYTMALNALDSHSEDCDFMRLMLHSALEAHDLARMFFESFITDIYKFMGDYIEQRQADGAFREIEPRIVVRAFIGNVRSSFALQHSLGQRAENSENFQRRSGAKFRRDFTERNNEKIIDSEILMKYSAIIMSKQTVLKSLIISSFLSVVVAGAAACGGSKAKSDANANANNAPTVVEATDDSGDRRKTARLF